MGDSFTYANLTPLSVFTPHIRRTISTPNGTSFRQIITRARRDNRTLTKHRRIVFNRTRPNPTNNIRYHHRRQLRPSKPITMTQQRATHRMLILLYNPLPRLNLNNIHNLFNRRETSNIQHRANNSITRANPTCLSIRTKTSYRNRGRNLTTPFRVPRSILPLRGANLHRTLRINLRPSNPKHNNNRGKHDTLFRGNRNDTIDLTPHTRVPHNLPSISKLQLYWVRKSTKTSKRFPPPPSFRWDVVDVPRQ